ncbi:glycosyltransferase family 2 protein [Candidatus Pacearchaeota archaeon]|nr:glycosyltransferase family 2 protein [Candidatus Pacearchaeota archaeon]
MDLYLAIIYVLSYIGLFTVSFYMINTFSYYKKKKFIGEKEDKTVTIIIPAFNEEKSIAKTIESALSSNYPKEKLEIIVVNDGSSDKTYEIAKKYLKNKKFKVRVFTKENGGKGTALNLGISKANGEIIITMDADSFIRPDTVRKMVGHFYNNQVMSVTPSMGVYKPKGALQRVQQVEYYVGIFLRKSFAVLNAIHITPGAFSAYRKKFFEKYGGYDVGNITEDLEIALRMQRHNFIIENAPEAVVYTIAPNKFRDLLVQRRRWYVGMIKNFWDYRDLFGVKKGAMGMLVLPLAVISVIFSVILTMYALIKTLGDLKTELLLLNSINFEFTSIFEANWYFIKTSFEKLFYKLFTNPILLLVLIFIILLFFYMHFARKNMKFEDGTKLSLLFFVALYSFLFSFWWILSFIYAAFNKKVVWRGDKWKKE